MMDNPVKNAVKPRKSASKSNQIRSLAVFSPYDQDALGIIRLGGAAKLAGWEILRGYDVNDHTVHHEVIDNADLVIVQREFCRDYTAYVKLTSLAHAQNKPLVFDLDDNIFILPHDHPDRLTGYYVWSLLPTLQAVMDADLVTVATNPLREFLLPYNPNIQVIPNYLDDTLWNITPYIPRESKDGKIIIGYMGGNSHQPDIQMVLPVLVVLLEKYPGRIGFHFWGIETPQVIAEYSQVDWYPPAFFRYDEFASAFQSQSADVMLAPLCDNPFNTCKSPIKFLEYSAAGLPGIYSRVSPYIDMIENGKDGILASTPEEWMAGITRLIENPTLRQKIVENAQRKINLHWRLSKNYAKRVKIYEKLVSKFQPKTSPGYFFYALEKSLAEQYHEEQVRTATNIHAAELASNKKLAEKDESIQTLTETNQELNTELAGMADSFSWRVTRPLRTIGKVARRRKHA